jgi:hypothetical protein
MVLLIIALAFLIQINAIPGTVIIAIPDLLPDPYIEGNSSNLWYKIKTYGLTINRNIYLLIYDAGTRTNIYKPSIAALGDSIKGCIGIQFSFENINSSLDFYIANYPTLKGMMMGIWMSSSMQALVTHCDNVVNTKKLELCIVAIKDVTYDASHPYVSYFANPDMSNAATTFNNASYADKWALTYLSLYMSEAEFNSTKQNIPSNVPYIFAYEGNDNSSSYIENVVRYAKTAITCHPWCTDCTLGNDASHCLTSCQQGYDLTGTTCACTSPKTQIGTGTSATCNCTGNYVIINSICTQCPGQTKINSANDGCDCWDKSAPTGASSDVCPQCPGKTKLNGANICDCWDDSVPIGVNSDECTPCPGDTVLNDMNTDCVCTNNFERDANDTCFCEFLFGATLTSQAICGCPDTSILNGDKTECVCPDNNQFNFSTMKCEVILSIACLYKMQLLWLLFVVLTI